MICSSACRAFMVELCAAFAANSQLISGLKSGGRSLALYICIHFLKINRRFNRLVYIASAQLGTQFDFLLRIRITPAQISQSRGD